MVWSAKIIIVYIFYTLHTVDRENFIVKKVTWNKKSLTRFNFVKAESIVCTSTKELH